MDSHDYPPNSSSPPPSSSPPRASFTEDEATSSSTELKSPRSHRSTSIQNLTSRRGLVKKQKHRRYNSSTGRVSPYPTQSARVYAFRSIMEGAMTEEDTQLALEAASKFKDGFKGLPATVTISAFKAKLAALETLRAEKELMTRKIDEYEKILDYMKQVEYMTEESQHTVCIHIKHIGEFIYENKNIEGMEEGVKIVNESPFIQQLLA